MFGNSSSFNNIFGGITQSHQRLFGGDRALATKDIEGMSNICYDKETKAFSIIFESFIISMCGLLEVNFLS